MERLLGVPRRGGVFILDDQRGLLSGGGSIRTWWKKSLGKKSQLDQRRLSGKAEGTYGGMGSIISMKVPFGKEMRSRKIPDHRGSYLQR